MSTVYATIPDDRLQMKMDEKGMLLDGQAGLRKKKETINNVYNSHFLANQQIRNKRCGMYINFFF